MCEVRISVYVYEKVLKVSPSSLVVVVVFVKTFQFHFLSLLRY